MTVCLTQREMLFKVVQLLLLRGLLGNESGSFIAEFLALLAESVALLFHSSPVGFHRCCRLFDVKLVGCPQGLEGLENWPGLCLLPLQRCLQRFGLRA